MKIPGGLSTGFAIGLALHTLTGVAYGQQSRPERPYRGLFDGGGNSDAEQVVSVSGSVGGGYDTNIAADASDAGLTGGFTPRARSHGGPFALLSGGLAYSLQKDAIAVGTSLSSSARYYPTVGRNLVASHNGAIGVTYTRSTRTSFTASQTITYEPFSQVSLFPEFQQYPLGQTAITDLDFATGPESYYSFTTGARATRQLTRHGQLSGGYQYERSDFPAATVGVRAGASDFSSHGGDVLYTHELSDGLGLRLGYGYSVGNYSQLEQARVARHNIDSGIDYRRALSFSRRTQLSFSTGASAVTDSLNTHFGAIGSVRLTHDLGRSWDFTAGYDRNVSFVETLSAPLFYDSAALGLTGLLTRRLNYHASAGAMLGDIGVSTTVSGSSRNYDTYYAATGLGMAINRRLSFGIDYSYYRYAFDQYSALPIGFDRDERRHTVRATLTAGAPLFTSGRRRNAAR